MSGGPPYRMPISELALKPGTTQINRIPFSYEKSLSKPAAGFGIMMII
jgi:hypothetical protein